VDSADTTKTHRDIWSKKPVLRQIYGDYYTRILDNCVPGRTLEIGGGSGNFARQRDDVISVDVQQLPWLDAVADAHALPFADACFANIVLVDVFHHLGRPWDFLDEVRRTLRPGGRMVMVEPAITPISWFIYHYMHPELVDMKADPLGEGAPLSTDEPFSSNQAIPTLVFEKHRERFIADYPELQLLQCMRFGLLSYPLSGGFRPWSLLPARGAGPLLRLEAAIEGFVAPVMAFRLLVVVERR